MEDMNNFFSSLCHMRCWLSRTFYRTQISFIGSRETVLFTPFGSKKVTQFSGLPPTSVSYLKVGDYSLKIQNLHIIYFLCSFQNEVFSLQTRKSFSEILSANDCFLRPGIRLLMPHNCTNLITSFTFLHNKSIVY